MMAIGDEDGPLRHETLHRRVSAGVGHDPEPVDNSQMVGGDQRRPIPQASLDGPQNLLCDVGIETEDRAEVEARRLVEGQPVGLRSGQRLLVGENLALAERLERTRAKKPLRLCVCPSTSNVCS